MSPETFDAITIGDVSIPSGTIAVLPDPVIVRFSVPASDGDVAAFNALAETATPDPVAPCADGMRAVGRAFLDGIASGLAEVRT